jgi:site-specific recombinase XerD
MNNGTETLKEFLNYIQFERGYSAHTVTAYQHDLEKFLNFIYKYDSILLKDFGKIDRQAIRHFLGKEYEEGNSAKTVARRLASIKSLFRYLVQTEVITDNPAMHVSSPKIEKRLPIVIQQKRIESLMKQPKIQDGKIKKENKKSRKGSRKRLLRNTAILELFYATGIRLSELVNLNIGSINFQSSPKIPLFCSWHENRIGVRRVQVILEDYLAVVLGSEDNYSREGANPHTLRHSFATHLIEENVDIRLIQELLGHSSLSSTQIYTKVNPKKLKEIYEGAHPHG